MSPEMKKYIDGVFSKYDNNRTGVIEMYLAKKMINDVVSEAAGEKTELTDDQLR